MSSWNYRIIVTEHVLPIASWTVNKELIFEICEVHYSDNKGKIPKGYTPASLAFDNTHDIKWRLKQMKKARKQPVLWGGDKFPQKYKKHKK